MSIPFSFVFDLDGVLLDSETDIAWLNRAAERTLAHFGIENLQQNLESLYAKNVKRFKEISDELGIEASALWPIRNKFYTEEKLLAMKQGSIKPFSDVKEIYKLQREYELSIISNSPQSVVDLFINDFGFSDLFSFGIGRGDSLTDIEHMKPHPFLFTRFSERTSATSYMYIGDRPSDRVFAENTGMSFALIDRFDNQNDGFFSLSDLVDHILSKKELYR
jgi:phosphoglycolate phosphatase